MNTCLPRSVFCLHVTSADTSGNRFFWMVTFIIVYLVYYTKFLLRFCGAGFSLAFFRLSRKQWSYAFLCLIDTPPPIKLRNVHCNLYMV
jgi:hypothetical protein